MASFTHEEDLKLIKIVESARTIQEGFSEAAEALGLTFYVCRNRWYTNRVKSLRKAVREGKVDEIVEEKEEKATIVEYIPPVTKELDTESLLNEFTGLFRQLTIAIRNELDKKERENAALNFKYVQLKENFDSLERDFASLSSIINRARQLSVEESIGAKPQNPVFKMETNGNLEAI